MKYAAILAAGTGTRMGHQCPKQFLELAEKPIVIWTLERILTLGVFDRLIVTCQKEWIEHLKKLVEKFHLDLSKIEIIEGGADRLASIENVLIYIRKSHSINEKDSILIHDAVRPFIQKKLIEDSIKALEQYKAVVAALPVVDTMLWCDNKVEVTSMPDRSKLFHGQAPDTFNLKTLHDSMKRLTNAQRKIVTGTAQICLLNGVKVGTVPGDPLNIKITTPNDLLLAEFILNQLRF